MTRPKNQKHPFHFVWYWLLFIISLFLIILPWLTAGELSEEDFAAIPGASTSWNAFVDVHGRAVEWPLGTVTEGIIPFAIIVFVALFSLGKTISILIQGASN